MAYLFDLVAEDGSVSGTLVLGHLDRSYRLEDGVRIPLFDGIGWCGQCHRPVEIESLKAMTAIDAEILRLQAGDTGAKRAAQSLVNLMGYDVFADDPDAPRRRQQMEEEEMREWFVIKTWRLERISPARCLRCGATAVTAYPENLENIQNPETGERFRVQCRGHASLAVHHFYTSEGLKIASESEEA